MRRLLLILALLPGPALADGLSVAPRTVEACYASALPGETAPKCLGAASNACQTLPGGDTTVGIVTCIGKETAVWDTLLNRGYKKLRAGFRKQGNGLPEALVKTQRAWIGFRDAQCALDYARWGNGSMRGIAAANCMMVMTAARAIELRDMGETR
ncbi:lysozyme inhibitor LprI family protein [Acidimangrovimonas sediminis]|uniref:lysozyme inhibitor LprI family protein n=1 Tax=Acidimangrovimonas sediminis TaxID=2056283 RepID=UPI000C7FF2D3|nr:lysozyme inhibitor LprI family protein [Acidimangrovimonas sediminis]